MWSICKQILDASQCGRIAPEIPKTNHNVNVTMSQKRYTGMTGMTLLLIEQKMCSALLYLFPIISTSLSLSYQNHLRANKAVCSCCGWMTPGNADHSEMFLYYCFTPYESCVSQHAVVREVWWHMRMHLNVYSLDEKLMYLCMPRWSCWCTNKSWLQRETEGVSEKERG